MGSSTLNTKLDNNSKFDFIKLLKIIVVILVIITKLQL